MLTEIFCFLEERGKEISKFENNMKMREGNDILYRFSCNIQKIEEFYQNNSELSKFDGRKMKKKCTLIISSISYKQSTKIIT